MKVTPVNDGICKVVELYANGWAKYQNFSDNDLVSCLAETPPLKYPKLINKIKKEIILYCLFPLFLKYRITAITKLIRKYII